MARLSSSCELCQETQSLQADTDIESCIDTPTGRTTFYVAKLKLKPKAQPDSIAECPIRKMIAGRKSGSTRT